MTDVQFRGLSKAFGQHKVLDDIGLSNPTEMMAKTLFLQAVPEKTEKKYNALFTEIKAG